MDTRTVLIVDDEPDMLENCERLLSREGYLCKTLVDPTRVRTLLRDLEPDVLLLDLRMPEVNGMTILTVALAEDPALPVIIMTGYGTVASAVQAIGEGAFDYLTKPFSGDELQVAVQRAVCHRELTLENRALRQQIAHHAGAKAIIGSSPAITRLLDQAQKVASANTNVLITGESGTGKELLARYIHDNSPRRDRPFMPVDCAAMPETLLESEVFGYERGAFTGATDRKRGLLEEANRGTVLFDEITELSLGLQSKLLRVLEERQLRRLGSTAFIDVDIRIVAATNVDLAAAVADGTFREDLYYRLNVIPLCLPPLRERNGDAILIARKFFAQLSADQEKEPPHISADVWDALETYHWPGNVRELRNVVERLIVLDEDGRITLADLKGVLDPHSETSDEEPVPPLSYEAAQTNAMHSFRTSYLNRLLKASGGNISRAARMAGVSRRTLHRWLSPMDHTPSNEEP